jgi:valyl-tRNA synthetase
LDGLEIVDQPEAEESKIASKCFEARFNQALVEINDHYSKFRISDALLSTYKLIWDDYCAWYLEMIKPEFGKPISKATHQQAINFFEKVLQVLHPFMPFITEELYHAIGDRKEKDCIIVSAWPTAQAYNTQILNDATVAFEIVSELRNVRNGKGISPKVALDLFYKKGTELPTSFFGIIQKLSNLNQISEATEVPANAITVLVKACEFYIPMENQIDVEKERENLEKELVYNEGFLNSILKKLGNERFVQNAPPQVIEGERKKQRDAEEKIRILKETLAGLN